MKRTSLILLAPLLSALLFTQCKKDDPNAVFNASFYTNETSGRLLLYIDDAYKGELPHFSKEPGCGAQNSDGQLLLAMQLRSGTYRVVGKDTAGRVVSSGTVSFSKNTSEASGGIGGQSLYTNGDCVVIGLYE